MGRPISRFFCEKLGLPRNPQLRTPSRYHATAIAVATTFASESGSRNFHPNDIN
jgi:hypothetical protein